MLLFLFSLKRRGADNISDITKLMISSEEIAQINNVVSPQFDTYVSPLINMANRYSQATTPRAMEMSIALLFEKYMKENSIPTLDEWRKFLLSNISKDKINEAVEKIHKKLQYVTDVATSISKKEVQLWVEDLLFNKSYNGLFIQQVILKKIALNKNAEFKSASKLDESKGIDGYIGGIPYSVKPRSYYLNNPAMKEWISANMVFYEKTKKGLEVEVYENFT